MTTHCYTQLLFTFQRKLAVDFAGGTITSDAGLLLVRELDSRLGLSQDIVRRINDSRDGRYITHEMDVLLRQRIYQIAAGYEDANDADRLRLDPTFAVVAGDGKSELASQPTISRLENDLDWSSIARLSSLGVDWFCAHAYRKGVQPRELVLDVDSTDDPTHGAQQLALFHGAYDQYMYHPLCWFEAHTGLLLRTRLRPGLDQSHSFLVEDLQCLTPKLKRRFPKSQLLLRGDAGMTTPRVLAALEDEQIKYVLGISTNNTFKKKVKPMVERAQARCQRTGRPVQIRTSFWHRGKRWPHRRRILIKLDVSATAVSVRFKVTNRCGRAKDLIDWYEQRGTAENRIKELKLDMHADRLSCHHFRANAVRLQLHTLALLLLSYFRRAVLAGTALADATIGTLRVQLFKVGARVVRTVRRIWFHLASHWPGQSLFHSCYQAVARAPA